MLDESVDVTEQIMQKSDKIKALNVAMVKATNELTDLTASQHRNMVELRETVGVDSPGGTEQALEIQAMTAKEVRDELNSHDNKSWGKVERMRDRLLRVRRGQCNEDDDAFGQQQGDPPRQTSVFTRLKSWQQTKRRGKRRLLHSQ